MIVFLTLCYCAVLALLVKLNVIKLTLWWKISPVAWMLLLFVVLFIPMQWGAPAGKVNVYQTVVEIIPNVSGEVTEVPVQPLKPLKKGDVLFRIDPTPFQDEVDRLQSQLIAAKQNVEQLNANLDAATATVTQTTVQIDLVKSQLTAAQDAVDAASAAVAEAEASQEAANTDVADREKQLTVAVSRVDRLKKLLGMDVVAQEEFDAAEQAQIGLQGQLNISTVNAKKAASTLVRMKADLAAAQSNLKTVEIQLKQTAGADLQLAKAREVEARLAAESMIGDVHTSVAVVQAQLDKAGFDLEQTTVKAPADGYVIGLSLRPGQRVANLPLRSWMAFVNAEQTKIVVGINQNTMRHVKPGQTAEVALKLYPGKTFPATVESIAYLSPSGQLQPSGVLPSAPTEQQAVQPFGVILAFDDQVRGELEFPGGTAGSAAIYTDNSKATHVIRKVMIRMETFLNYLNPY